MLKNWTITTEPVRNGSDGIIARERYLLSNSHPNHRRTDALISIIGDRRTSQRIALLGEQFRLKQQLSKKGGRPLTTYAMEYCLTLPKGYRPTPQQWRLIIGDCCKALAHLCQLEGNDLKQFKACIRAVLHQQNQERAKGSGDHVHLIVSKIIGGNVLKALQQKKGTKVLKQAFNTAVLNRVGINYRDYKPHELSRGKRLELWKYQCLQADEALRTEKLIAKMQEQSSKWFEALELEDTSQQSRSFNRLLETLEELEQSSLPNDISKRVEQMKAKMREKNQQKVP